MVESESEKAAPLSIYLNSRHLSVSCLVLSFGEVGKTVQSKTVGFVKLFSNKSTEFTVNPL